MQAPRAAYDRVPGWLLPAIVILVLAMAPGLAGARIDGDLYQEQHQDLQLSIARAGLWLASTLILVIAAVSLTVAALRTRRRGRPSGQGFMLPAAAVVGAIMGGVVGGVAFGSPTPQRDGSAQVRIADITVGRSDNGVTCYGHGPGALPSLVVSAGTRGGMYTGGDRYYQWLLRGSWESPEVRLLLELPTGGRPPARAEVAIGSSVYRSTHVTPVVVEPLTWAGDEGQPVTEWPAGSATLNDMTLVSGPPWGGREAVSLWIQWICSRV